MRVAARPATRADLADLVRLYRGLEEEMTALHPMWPLADGLPEPVDESLAAAIDDADAHVLVGEIEGVALGFLLARAEPMLPQAGGRQVGVIRLIYVEPDAREVAVGETMRDTVMELFRSGGITKFDAHVLPGHRLAKNFFEAGGFSARAIVMHHDDERER